MPPTLTYDHPRNELEPVPNSPFAGMPRIVRPLAIGEAVA
jgi:hypothetical protein